MESKFPFSSSRAAYLLVPRAGKTPHAARGNTRTLARTRTASLPCNIGVKKQLLLWCILNRASCMLVITARWRKMACRLLHLRCCSR